MFLYIMLNICGICFQQKCFSLKFWLMNNRAERFVSVITNHMMHIWFLLLLIDELFRRSWHRHNTTVRISLCHPDSLTESVKLRIVFIWLHSFVLNLSLPCMNCMGYDLSYDNLCWVTICLTITFVGLRFVLR